MEQLPPKGVKQLALVLLVFLVSLIKHQSPSFEQYSLISSDVWGDGQAWNPSTCPVAKQVS